MYLCIVNRDGASLVHRNMSAGPAPFLTAIAPSREEVVVCVAGLFTWYWLADLGARAGMPFVLGHALSRQAIHGGKANNDRMDAQKIAVWRRGEMLPHAEVSPAERRATRELLRRRMPRTRTRAQRLAPLQHTTSQYHLPEMGKTLASKANRAGVAERFPDPAVPKSFAGDLGLMGDDDPGRNDLAFTLVNTAKPPHAQTLYRRQSVPGIGPILALVLLYAMHAMVRFPRVQDGVSSCRLGTCTQAAAGKRSGTSGAHIGKASRTWAFSEAAVMLLRHHPAGHKEVARVENKHGKGQALTI
jgi:transposase